MNKIYFGRREFFRTGTLWVVSSIPIFEYACRQPLTQAKDKGTWIDQMIQFNDEHIPASLKNQQVDPALPHFGGIPDAFQIFNPHAPAGLIQSLTCSYTSPGSRYYHDDTILHRMDIGIDYILLHQHSDGTIDLLTTNFHSTPDVAFVVEPIALAYKLMAKDDHPASMTVRRKLQSFLVKAGSALVVGGIHTPNHRWVVCMALARINDLFPEEKYIKRINQWLAEKIDIDADGQYNERSTSVYSPMTDRWLITIAALLQRPELYLPVRRNLDMTQYLIHPNGDLVTELSRRQDQYTTAPCLPYFYSYHYMATVLNEEEYAPIACWIFKKYGIKSISGYLPYFLENNNLWNEPKTDIRPSEHYEKYFEHSDLVRWRDGETDASLMAQNSNLFSMQHGGVNLQAVRCATAFFGKGQFIGTQVQKIINGYEINQKLEGPYFQPFPVDSLPEDGDWDKMPRDKRPTSEVQSMDYKLMVIKMDHGFKLKFSLAGTEGVPIAVELNFKKSPGDTSSGTQAVPDVQDGYFFKETIGKYSSHNQSIWIQGGLHQHGWTALRGALPKLSGNSLYITGYTPFEHEIILSTAEII